MGYIKDEAIVFTGNERECRLAQWKADQLGLHHTGDRVHAINGLRSFLIVPDGSKEGWEESREGDNRRELWKIWARETYGKRVDYAWFHAYPVNAQ